MLGEGVLGEGELGEGGSECKGECECEGGVEDETS